MSSRLSQASIRTFFAALPDPRKRRTRVKHPLLTLVVIALCGNVAGADTWEEMVQFARDRHDWLARLVDLSAGIPSHDTFGRVFAALDPLKFQKCLLNWVQRLHEVTKGQVIAIDGKAVEAERLSDTRLRLRSDPPGTTLRLTVRRGGDTRPVALTLADQI